MRNVAIRELHMTELDTLNLTSVLTTPWPRANCLHRLLEWQQIHLLRLTSLSHPVPSSDWERDASREAKKKGSEVKRLKVGGA